MTTKRAFGTETEFGIAARDPESADPVSNSLFLINHYPCMAVQITITPPRTDSGMPLRMNYRCITLCKSKIAKR